MHLHMHKSLEVQHLDLCEARFTQTQISGSPDTYQVVQPKYEAELDFIFFNSPTSTARRKLV